MWSVIGQTRAVSLLQRSLERNSLAHAYLFSGPAHVGKMTLALNLAQALNCEAKNVPCGECASCQKVKLGKHADAQIVGLGRAEGSDEAKPQAEISIEQVRQVQHSASLPPFEGKYKVFIIDGAEFLSNEAANCLLKTLEEPIGKVIFLLLTANERLLLATVVSRCQRVELFPLAITELEDALIKNWGVEPQKAKLLARLAHGCLGWAISATLNDDLLQQRVQHLDEVAAVLGADGEERFAYAAQLATQFSQNRQLVQERLDLWLDWWRDLLMVKAGSSESATNLDRITALGEMAGIYSLDQIRAVFANIQAAKEQLKQNANPQLVLEVLMLSIPETKYNYIR